MTMIPTMIMIMIALANLLCWSPLLHLQAFLSELYVYLIDEMHVGLGKVLAVEDQRPIPAPLTDSIQLKHFAREAEVNENFELAAKFYQEVSILFFYSVILFCLNFIIFILILAVTQSLTMMVKMVIVILSVKWWWWWWRCWWWEWS